MPASRVGVMPQPNQMPQRNVNRKGGGGTAGRQKGITMEDLKRQTAIRLAHEQNREQKQHGGYQNSEDSTNYPLANQQRTHNMMMHPHPKSYRGDQQYQYPSSQGPPHGNSYQHSYHKNYHPHQHAHQNQPNYQHSGYENYPNQHVQRGQYYDREPENAYNYRNQNQNNVQYHDRSPHPGFSHDHKPYYRVKGPNSQSGLTPSDRSSTTKLPHGLTVRELKEMTKARLQAEAAEMPEPNALQENIPDRRLSPLDFDASTTEVRERAMSRDSAGRNHAIRVSASDSMNSIPSLVQVDPTNRDQMGRQLQASPVPAGFQNLGQMNEYQFATSSQAWEYQQQQLKLDALETASLNSYNNSVVSDNLGSESAFSSGIGSGVLSQPDSEFASMPFTRSLSYTTGQQKANEGKIVDGRSGPSSACASPASSGNIFFDAAVGSGNRRRAATLSPRPGSILEDYPQFDGDLAMPNFSSGGQTPLLSRSNRNNASSAVSEHNLFLGQQPGIFGFDDDSNRPRTQSTNSLPPLSHTAEQFGAGQAPPGFSNNTGFEATGSIPSNGRVDTLASQMGSILNLSVGESRPDRERLNTYPQTSRSQTPDYISEEFFNKSGDSSFRF